MNEKSIHKVLCPVQLSGSVLEDRLISLDEVFMKIQILLAGPHMTSRFVLSLLDFFPSEFVHQRL
jgi:hypothetical protein